MTVMTVIGEVQTHEEATVYVKEINIHLTVKVFEGVRILIRVDPLKNQFFY